MIEYCYRCKAELPAFGHDAICDSCDKMLVIYKQDEVIAELLEALKDMLSGWRYIRQDPAHRNIYGVGWDRAQEKAEAAIAKAEGREA